MYCHFLIDLGEDFVEGFRGYGEGVVGGSGKGGGGLEGLREEADLGAEECCFAG